MQAQQEYLLRLHGGELLLLGVVLIDFLQILGVALRVVLEIPAEDQ